MSDNNFCEPQVLKDDKLIALGDYIKEYVNVKMAEINPDVLAVKSVILGNQFVISALQYPVLFINRSFSRTSQNYNVRFTDIVLIYGLQIPTPPSYSGIMNWMSYQLTQAIIEWRQEEDQINPDNRRMRDDISFNYTIFKNEQSQELIEALVTSFQIKES